MARRVDPETYLRLAWEQTVLSDERRRMMSDANLVAAVGRVLVAADVLGVERANAVNDEYHDALRLRGGGFGPFFAPRPPAGPPIALSVQRLALCAVEFVAGTTPMTLTQVIFTNDGVELDLSGSDEAGNKAAVRARARMMGPRQIGPTAQRQVLTVRDDSGVVVTASASSSSSGGGNWEAHFTTDAPLAASTTWLEIDGVRVDLPIPVPVPRSRIEPIAADGSLRAALRREIINDLQARGPQSLDLALGALVATGVIDADDPLAEEARQISDAISRRHPLPGTPEPWRSVVQRSTRNDGPVGRLPIGVAVIVDDTTIRLDSLHSEPHVFSLALTTSPGRALLAHGPRPHLSLPPIEWWAEDDRGNRYLFVNGNGGGSDRVAQGAVQSLAPLDPTASELRLMPTGAHERAVVTIPLTALATK